MAAIIIADDSERLAHAQALLDDGHELIPDAHHAMLSGNAVEAAALMARITEMVARAQAIVADINSADVEAGAFALAVTN